MTNTQKLAKEAFRKLRHLIISNDYSTQNLRKYNAILEELYEQNSPRISDFQSIGELDMISLFGLNLCRQKIMDIYTVQINKSDEFNELIKIVSTIEESIASTMDFDKLSMLLDHRIGDLSDK